MNEGRKRKVCPDEDMMNMRKLLYILEVYGVGCTVEKWTGSGRVGGLSLFELE
jgi:hypothetical protein